MTGAAHRTPAGKPAVIPNESVPDERLRRPRLAARGDERKTGRRAGWRSARPSRRLAGRRAPRRLRGRGGAGKPARTRSMAEAALATGPDAVNR